MFAGRAARWYGTVLKTLIAVNVFSGYFLYAQQSGAEIRGVFLTCLCLVDGRVTGLDNRLSGLIVRLRPLVDSCDERTNQSV
jgi:hypothetical protein